MYDIQTLFSVPEGFNSKAIVTSLRAFGDKTNTMSLKPSVSKHAKAECSPPPRFPSQKASATVALTSTTALRSWKPLSSTPHDDLHREENAVPFPTTPACEHIPAQDPPPGLKRPLPVETRRRRSGALVPPSARASSTVLIRPIAKRPRKSRRVLADLQFMASVHRSIVAFHAGSRRQEASDTGVDAMNVDEGSGSRDHLGARVKRELLGMDQQLVARLVQRLRAGGFASTLMDARPAKELSQLLQSPLPPEGTRAPPPSPEMDSGVDAMDVTPDLLPASLVTSSPVFRLPPLPTVLPPPPPPPPVLGNSAPPRSPPGLVSPRVPPQVPTEKLIYTMPQLVATHILRIHERGVRTPNSLPRTPRTRSPLNKSLGP